MELASSNSKNYSGYFSEIGVPFASGARCSVSQIAHAQNSCVGLLGRQEVAAARGLRMTMPVKCCRLFDGDGGSGGVSQSVFCQGRLVLWDIHRCYLGEGGTPELFWSNKFEKSLLKQP